MEKIELTIRESQLAALEILKKIDEYCNKLDIKYWLMYGTLIGAVRHDGFIPWDDDLDIGMFQDDYMKFSSFFQKNQGDLLPLEIHNQNTNEDCFFNIVRVCDKRYFLEFDGMNYVSGIFVDIYVFEGLGRKQDLKYWEKRFKKYDYYRKMVYMSCNTSIFYGSNFIHKIANLPWNIISKIRGKKYYIDKFNSYKKFSLKDSDYVGVPSWEKVLYKKTLFTKVVRKNFEGYQFLIPMKYDELLKIDYGNYMELPDVTERCPHHGYRAYKIIENKVEK